jgi:hypothetical protein
MPRMRSAEDPRRAKPAPRRRTPRRLIQPLEIALRARHFSRNTCFRTRCDRPHTTTCQRDANPSKTLRLKNFSPAARVKKACTEAPAGFWKNSEKTQEKEQHAPPFQQPRALDICDANRGELQKRIARLPGVPPWTCVVRRHKILPPGAAFRCRVASTYCSSAPAPPAAEASRVPPAAPTSRPRHVAALRRLHRAQLRREAEHQPVDRRLRQRRELVDGETNVSSDASSVTLRCRLPRKLTRRRAVPVEEERGKTELRLNDCGEHSSVDDETGGGGEWRRRKTRGDRSTSKTATSHASERSER